MSWYCPDCQRTWNDKDVPPPWHFGYLKEADGKWRIGQASRYVCKGKPVSGGADDDSD